MKTCIVNDDLIVSIAVGAIGIPLAPHLDALPFERLRYVNGEVVDVAAMTDWHIDSFGRKRMAAGPGRQPLSCQWDDEIESAGGAWRVVTVQVRLERAIKAECRRRIVAEFSQAAQMNLTAAAAVGALNDAGAVAFAAGHAWIASMRGKCQSLIAAGDASFSNDAHWPPIHVAAKALIERF